MTTKEYQLYLLAKLQQKFAGVDIEEEWKAFKGISNQYSPRVDIAIGEFNDVDEEENTARVRNEYNKLVRSRLYKPFLQQAYNFHSSNLDQSLYTSVSLAGFLEAIEHNKNPRCFIAIEIENRNSRKHVMGSIVNAASLGKIGIGIGFDDETTRTFLRILNYLSKLQKVEKNSYDSSNFLVLTRPQMEQLL